MNAIEIMTHAVEILNRKKAENIRAVKISDLTIIGDYFVIANGTSSTQVRSLAEEVEFQLKETYGLAPLRVEGFDTKNWIVLDYGTVLVHVFYKDTRDFYDLEKLWSDGEQVDLSHLLTD